ncbi:MAG: hypothetical protein DRN09_03115 [Thermoplasmata archaeon]|nr:MAG: hypothetical protein DRN09_03115 [Thermoplasmata archaeon]
MYVKVNADKCSGCRECEFVCSTYHFNVSNSNRSGIRIEKKGLTDDIPHVCTHGKDCNFECIDACKFDAMKKKDGIVYVDYDKCVGCGACERACPINAVWIFEKKAYKCDLCQGEPRCVKVCSQGALEIGGA